MVDNHFRILLVDDDEAFSAVMQRVLTRHQYDVEYALNGTDALQIAENFKPNIILLDLKMNDESGLQLIEPLLEKSPHSKIIMLTGYGSIPTAVEAMKRGAANYLSKPIESKALVEMIRKESAGQATTENTIEDNNDHNLMSLRRAEWEHIQRALDENSGNISATARALNMHRRTLQRKLQKKPGS